MRTNLIIRAEGNAEIGLGHLFRSFAFASIIVNKNITFVCSENSFTSVIPENLNHLIINDFSLQSEELEYLAKLFNPKKSILLTDGYQFNLDYQKKAKALGFELICVDDFLHKNYAADIVINHAPISVSSANRKQFALGIPYAMLRKPFLIEAKKPRVLNKIRNCFISFGGSDYNQLAVKSAQACLESNSFEQITIVSGLSSHEALTKEFDQKKGVRILNSLSAIEMIQEMQKAQIAILPASTISYEASCLGLIIIGGYYVDNQKMIYEGMLNKGLIYDAGNFNDVSVNELKEIVLKTSMLPEQDKLDYLRNQFDNFNGSQIENLNRIVQGLKD